MSLGVNRVSDFCHYVQGKFIGVTSSRLRIPPGSHGYGQGGVRWRKDHLPAMRTETRAEAEFRQRWPRPQDREGTNDTEWQIHLSDYYERQERANRWAQWCREHPNLCMFEDYRYDEARREILGE